MRARPFRPALRRRLHEDVAEQLRDAILDGRLRPGEKLPPERELAERFRANRTSIREAIKVLEALGLVKVRQGDGATVQPLIEGSLELIGPMIFHGGRIDVEILHELLEVVMPLLYQMARLALDRFRPEQLDEMRRLRDVIADVHLEREERFAASRQLLVLLSDMTANRIWQMLARRTRDLFASPPLRETRHRLRRDPAHLLPCLDGCLEAMQSGRSDAALASVQQLIRAVSEPPGQPRNKRAAGAA